MKKDTCIILSLVALTLSFVAIFGIHKNIVCFSDLILTLLGVLATIIVGVSVVNALELHQIYLQMKEIDKIQKDIDDTKTDLEKMRNHANLSLHIAYGLAFLNWKPNLAISESLKSLEIAMRQNDASRTNTCLDVLQEVLKQILNDNKLQAEVKKKNNNIKKIPKEMPDWYKDSKNYNVFKKRLETVFQEIKKLID